MSVIDIGAVPAADKPLLWHALQDYIDEMTRYDRSIKRSGGVYVYQPFEAYWSDEGRWPFWVKVDGAVAGFALVRAVDGATEMAEFYIRPDFRRAGIGREFADNLIARFPGPWILSQFRANAASIAFWHRVIAVRPFTEREYVSVNGNQRIEQRFSA